MNCELKHEGWREYMVGQLTGPMETQRLKTNIASSMISLRSKPMSLYDFQKQTYELLSTGRSVILQAPTGAGKTRAALYPFLRGWERNDDFPRKCIYSVPLRVLANQFWDEYEGRVRNFGFQREMDVTIQTGARLEDPKLEGNLIFTTIDQTLSNFLNIPYALSLGQGNLNAGAVLSSYLVFDELHLFDPETTLPTTLHLLRLLRGVVPFLIMTATLSKEIVGALAKELNAEPLLLSAAEIAAIPSQDKTRQIHIVETELSPQTVLTAHQKRSIAICNTVERAQTLFEGLRQQAGQEIEIRLLHSRFLRKDRETIETWLQQEFGKDKDAYNQPSAILVATQVVEVGLDITSQVLHTELAPAASIVQRAGRCARYQNEIGNVFVYRLPVDDNGHPRYAPYTGIQAEVCAKSWETLAKRSGQIFTFETELAVVNQTHGEADRQLLAELRGQRFYIADRIAKTIETQERGAARELIRAVDSRTVIVHSVPTSIDNPWAYEGFGIFRGSLFGAYETLVLLAEALDEDWAVMTADPMPEEEGSQERTVWKWRYIVDKEDLQGTFLVAINPRLVFYNSQVGFRLGIASDGNWQSPLRERSKPRRSFAPYRRETFQEHVQRMLQVYFYPFYDREAKRERQSLAEELSYAARRIEAKHRWPEGILDRLTRLIITLHDLGKLDIHWQDWAHRWQEEVSILRGMDLAIGHDYLAAHTDYDDANEAEKILNKKLRRLKPNHAAESAAAVTDWLLQQIGDQALTRAALTAIVRHHSAGASGRHGEFKAHPAATAALFEVMDATGLDALDIAGIQWAIPAGEALSKRLIRSNRPQELLPYLLFIRALRLADGRSQEIER
jgi:CRISPR-associated endonuclease/helicase Cas3